MESTRSPYHRCTTFVALISGLHFTAERMTSVDLVRRTNDQRTSTGPTTVLRPPCGGDAFLAASCGSIFAAWAEGVDPGGLRRRTTGATVSRWRRTTVVFQQKNGVVADLFLKHPKACDCRCNCQRMKHDESLQFNFFVWLFRGRPQ